MDSTRIKLFNCVLFYQKNCISQSFPQSQSFRSLKLLFAAFKDNLQASFLAVCCSTLSCDSGCKSVASRASLLKSSINTGVAYVRKDSSQVRTSITVFSQATSGSLGVVKVTAADTGISLWVRDDDTIPISVCLRIIDISIPDLTLKIFECRLFAICISPSTCSHRCAFCLRAYVDSFELIFN